MIKDKPKFYPKKKNKSKRTIRRGDVVSVNGVGSIYSFKDHYSKSGNQDSLMLAGLSHWQSRMKEESIPDEWRIDEPRLKALLDKDYFVLPPDYREDSEDKKLERRKLPYYRFPNWHYCPQSSCGKMKYLGPTNEGNEKCSNKHKRAKNLIPIRFVVICENGHIDNFPFFEWVHQKNSPIKNNPEKENCDNSHLIYVAGKGVNPLANGMATAADWMSAASFISMAGLIAFMGKDGSVYLMGWTGGYVLLALLLAPYLRKFGQFTVPDFIGTRYYSRTARLVAVLCLIFVSFTYVAGQMRGVGIVFSRFLEVDINQGVIIGMIIVFFYAVLGGMKGITYTQVAQYCVLIFAYLVPAIFISILMTGNPIPQLGFGDTLIDSPTYLLDKLDQVTLELGFPAYTENIKSNIDIFCITAALMFGTAGLPHVIVRFFTVPKVSDARKSAGYALVFIALLYTTAPAVGAFARVNFIDSVQDTKYIDAPSWFKNWENIGLISWNDKNNDGIIRYEAGNTFKDGRPQFIDGLGQSGERMTANTSDMSNQNEVYIDRDIMVLANPR